METRLIGPREFGEMLGVSGKTAARHMSKQRECINVSFGRKQYLRIPLEVAEDIVNGLRPLSAVEPYEQIKMPQLKKKARSKRTQPVTHYVPYR